MKKYKLVKQRILENFEKWPLFFIVSIAFLIRLVAVFCSHGYLMHDDHFLVIEAAQSWIDNYDYNNWLPENSKDGNPTGHSMFYVGLHYVFFYILSILNIEDPSFKMFMVRLIHAIYSLLIVLIGYKITNEIDSKKSAIAVGFLLSIFWFFPVLSVHNLVEFVCIPPLLGGLWYSLRYKKHNNLKYIILAGILFGISIGLRIQTCLFPLGIGIILFFEKRWIAFLLITISVIVSLFTTQIADVFIWGYPFAEMREYISYNLNNSITYGISPWYKYLLLIVGLLIPPISIIFLFGFLKNITKYKYIVIPSILFLVFHSIFPNKQERFILPLIPIIIIIGYIYFNKFRKNPFFIRFHNAISIFKLLFIIINTALLIIVSTSYTKKSRVETMKFFAKKSDLTGFFVDLSHNDVRIWQPLFYLEKWHGQNYVFSKSEDESIKNKIINTKTPVNYIALYGEENLENRLSRYKKFSSKIKYITKIEPGFMDKVLHYMNPKNRNETVYIYKIFTTK